MTNAAKRDVPRTSAVSAERVRQAVEQRETPRRGLTPVRLGQQLDDYRRGYMGVTRLWDDLIRQDWDLKLVAGKRADTVGRARWEILVDEDVAQGPKRAEAARHKEALQGFYSGVEATDVLMQDTVGGVGQLARFILEAKFHGCAALNVIWRPGIRGRATTATFQRCPPWWFESRTGRLRFLRSDYDIYGEDMDPRTWLTCGATALMEPSCVLWLYKNLGLRDWLSFSERFGMPALVGETSAEKDSPEWVALKEALASFGQDFAMVVNEGAKITPVSVAAAASAIPYHPLYEMLVRATYSLWLGGDLSTASAQTGQGQGASLQGADSEKVEDDDHRFVSEVAQRRVDPMVLAYHFGEGVEPLAYFKLCPPVRKNIDQELKVDEFFHRAGLAQDRATLYGRYARPMPEAVSGADHELVFESAPQTPPPAGRWPLSNTDDSADPLTEILRAAEADLAPLRSRLERIQAIEDPDVMAAALQRLAAELPQLARDLNADPASARAIEALLAQSLARGWAHKAGAGAPKPSVPLP